MLGHNQSCFSQMPLRQDPYWLRDVCTSMGKVLKQISQGGQNKVIGQKEDKDLEEPPYINDLTASFLCSPLKEDAHVFLSRCASLPCF